MATLSTEQAKLLFKKWKLPFSPTAVWRPKHQLFSSYKVITTESRGLGERKIGYARLPLKQDPGSTTGKASAACRKLCELAIGDLALDVDERRGDLRTGGLSSPPSKCGLTKRNLQPIQNPTRQQRGIQNILKPTDLLCPIASNFILSNKCVNKILI